MQYKHVLDELVRRGVVNKAEVIRPAGELERERLLDVHSTSYLDSLKRSSKVSTPNAQAIRWLSPKLRLVWPKSTGSMRR